MLEIYTFHTIHSMNAMKVLVMQVQSFVGNASKPNIFRLQSNIWSEDALHSDQSVKDETLDLVSVSRPKVLRLSILSRSCSNF